MKRPLGSLALAYAAGLLMARWLPLPLPALFVAAFLSLVIVLFFKKFRLVSVCGLLALVGWTNYSLHNSAISPNDLRLLVGTNATLATVRGTLLETPSLKVFLRDEELSKRSAVRMRLTEIRREDRWQPAVGDIIATVPDALPENYFVGQPVEVSGVLAPPPTPIAEGLFDYRTYLANQNIYHQLKSDTTNDWIALGATRRPPLSARFIGWAGQVLTMGLNPEDESTQLLLAMTLGQKTALNDDVSEPFMRSGTLHIFAISGLHIALIASILLAILRVAQLPRPACGLIVLPLIWFYTAATGWQPSAIRSTVMMSIIIGGWSLKRPSDLLNSLAAAGLVILIWDPAQLFQASFQLSFFVVFSIALFSPPISDYFDRKLKFDPLLPEELLPRWQRWAKEALHWVGMSFTTSLAAWIGSMPLTAFYFHLFSPVTLLANLLIVPLSSFALMANLASLLCGTWLPWATELFNHAAWLFMTLMIQLSERTTQLPGAFFYVPEISWGTVLVSYALIIGLFIGGLKTRSGKILSVATTLVLITICLCGWFATRAETQLTVLPLNGGHAVFVDAAGTQNDWLVNCGNENAVEFVMKNFLHAHGVNRIHHLVATEGDIRNCGGVPALAQIFPVGEFRTSREKFRSPTYREAVAHFENLGRHKIFTMGETNGAWEILFPFNDAKSVKADDRPLVMRGNFSGTKILLLSDLSRAGQNDLMRRNADLRADFIVAGLPSQGEPLSDALIAAVQPQVIIIADSEKPATRRASRALQERLVENKIPVLYTRSAGAVTIVFGSNGWRLRTMDGQRLSNLSEATRPQ